MKVRKNLTLSRQAISAGQRLAVQANTSLSAIVEQRLLGPDANPDELNAPFWDRPGKPVPRPGDRRYTFLTRKHK